MLPTADQIAVALVEAGRAFGEDPAAVASGVPGTLPGHAAFAALREVFPTASSPRLAACVGYPTPRAGPANLVAARKASWWREDLVDEIVGALVADQYGEQAA